MRMRSVSIVLAGALAALMMSAPSSSAAYGDHRSDGTVYKCGRNGNFPLCVYFNSNLKGAKVGIFGKVHNYDYSPHCSSQGCLPFTYSEGSGSAGYGQKVKNNAASVYNYNDTSTRVFYNSGWTGPADEWDPYGWGTYFGNLSATYNDNASQARVCGEC
ncbi:hypothetical protein ABZW67_10315 [Streptomyces rubiginosohelvolus]|uniref:hypothetical protein n=1 Tax=Streptomyces rubiginosohelvolus TaxID=67362 RepID=UPI0033B74184